MLSPGITAIACATCIMSCSALSLSCSSRTCHCAVCHSRRSLQHWRDWRFWTTRRTLSFGNLRQLSSTLSVQLLESSTEHTRKTSGVDLSINQVKKQDLTRPSNRNETEFDKWHWVGHRKGWENLAQVCHVNHQWLLCLVAGPAYHVNSYSWPWVAQEFFCQVKM